MSGDHSAVKTVLLGAGGTLASIGLAQWESIAAISAGFATALFVLVKTWHLLRGKD